MKREYMAATGAVMEKTANMYMELIADVEKRGVSVFCMCEVRGVGRKCGRCWSIAHPPELSLTAVATEGECGHLE